MRLTIRSRMSAITDLHRSFLDPFLVPLALQNALHEDPRRDDVIGIDLPGLDEMLDLGDRDLGGGRHHGVEVARRAAVDEVAGAIALPGLDEREVSEQRTLEHVLAAVDGPRLLALSDQRSEPRRREKAADARASGPDPLSECALGDEFHLEL